MSKLKGKSIVKFLKRIQYNSPVSLTFAVVSLVALLLGYLSDNKITALLFTVYRSSFTDPLAYFRVFGHVIGHADFTHYVSNFMMILILGPIIEEKYGSTFTLIIMILTAFTTGVLNLIFFPDVMLLGASGIVFMLIILSSFVNLQQGRIPLTLVLVLLVYIGSEIISAITIKDNISRFAHIAGGLCGAGIGCYINRDKLKREDR